MLVVVQDVVLGEMLHYLAGHNVFHTFAYDTCEGNQAVVGCLVLLSFLNFGATFAVFKTLGTFCYFLEAL